MAFENRLNRRTVLQLAGLGASAAMLPRSAHASDPPSADPPGGAHTEGYGPKLQTRLTQQLGLRVPLVSAGMAFVALPDLAAAVSNAGALGVYGVGPEPPPVLAARLQSLQELTSAP